MIELRNDYGTGAHPKVLEALLRTNAEVTPGYGSDKYCKEAEELIRRLCGSPKSDVFFFTGGTLVNKTAIGGYLRPCECVLCADTGHIGVHEAGSIEQDGHKIIGFATKDGKLVENGAVIEALRTVVDTPIEDFSVVPRLVYASNTTEVGTVYSKEEIEILGTYCKAKGLILFMDGARLACAMAAGDTDFADYAKWCDAFTIGGTKNGMLFGEALVVQNPALSKYFRNIMKQQGAVFAKGRLLGLQYISLLEDGTYTELGKHSHTLAMKAAEIMGEMGIRFLYRPQSNQIFPVFTEEEVKLLTGKVSFEEQCRPEKGTVCIRFVTSFSTTEEDIEQLAALLKGIIRR